MKILALCGSLRKQSRSMALLQAAQHLAAPGVTLEIFNSLADIPLFNPDDEPAAAGGVRALWSAVTRADAVLIASPEYAHGVTGALKNALDWLVGHEPFAGKPVAVFNPSHRAEHADAALKEILSTMAAALVPGACLRIAVTASGLDVPGLCADPEVAPLIRQALQALAAWHAEGPAGA
ncbi:MAG: NAD(P)H-dependent oxidoreductase [Ramlibacter sp.]|nr:NAD(P)H-dependent oxidoreductase [Ramlibacter sp.]